MSENYVAKYQEEASESSIVNDEDDFKDVLNKDKVVEKSEAPASATTENNRRQNKFVPYTFDPRSVLKDTQPKSSGDLTSAKIYNPVSIGESKYPSGNLNLKNYGTYNTPSYIQSNVKELFTQQQPDMSFLTTLGENMADCRKTDDYKNFAKEFEKQFGNDQREMEQVTKDLNLRTAKLDNFIKELQGADLDMILYKNRLVREIQDVQNDLKEAYNNILVLMNDRSTMRDQFCIFKMKIKKLKGFVKTFQDDIQAY